MKKTTLFGLLIAQSCMAFPAWSQEEITLEQPTPPAGITFQNHEKQVKAPEIGKLHVRLGGIADGKPIHPQFAYCAPDGKGRTANGGNISPAINWSGRPAGTQSYALIVVDRDVPSSFESANKEGQEIALKFPRKNFYHWVLVDIPVTTMGLLEGKNSNGVTPGGKPFGKTAYGLNGQNDYALMSQGPNGGYDGPCPPWNDLRLHHYHFIVYALDIPSLGLPSPVKGPQAEAAMEGHILAKGEVVGTYSNHPRWLPELKAQLAEQAKIEKADDTQQAITDKRKERTIGIKSNVQRREKPPAQEKELTPNDLIDRDVKPKMPER